MGSITLQVVAAKEEEFPKLQEAYRLHIREAVLKAARKKIDDMK